ncbi:MAG: hypothetical protein HKN43_06040 [Rhodothermales bacterium]|nr:hypothetical protein [Rhodothermales bacterium]
MKHTDRAGERPPPVAQMSGDELEGHLSAHRDLLSHLLAKLAADPETRKVLLNWLDERANVKDTAEDPGAVTKEGFTEQQARADEFRIISQDVRRLTELDG